jgi:alpha-glucosidase
MYPELLPQVRAVMALRVRLMPYLYTAMWRAALHDEPVVRPLFLDFPDDANATQLEDVFLLGPDLLVAPVLEEGETRRAVYLPAHPGGWVDWHDGRSYAGGAVATVEAPLGRLPVFVRAGAMIPCDDGAAGHEFLLFGEPGEASQAWLYEDDGETASWREGGGLARRFVRQGADGVAVAESTGSFSPRAAEPKTRRVGAA